MMNVISIGLLTMKKRIKMNVIFTLLTTMLFMLINIMFAGINNGTVRYEPFKEIFNNQGAFVSGVGFDVEDVGGINNYLTALGIPDGYKTMSFSDMYGHNDNGVAIRLVVCEDDFLDDLKLPVRSYVANSENTIAVSMPQNQSINIGDEFSVSLVFPGEVFKVTKLYTDFTYVPTMSRYSVYNEDYTMFYELYNINDKNSNVPFVLVRKSDVLNESETTPVAGFFVYYPNKISSEAYDSFIEKLPMSAFIEFKTLNDNSLTKQKNNLLKYLPIFSVSAMMLSFGFFCCIAIFTLSELKRMSIFSICGMNRRHCLIIYVVNIFTIIILALFLVGAILKIMSHYGANAKFGLIYSLNNIWLSVAFILFFALVSIIIPMKIVFSKKPYEMLREI